MKRIRVRMLVSVDQLYAGEEYNLPGEMALDLISRGKAVEKGYEISRSLPTFEVQQAGPSETKPVKPAEMKKKAKRNA